MQVTGLPAVAFEILFLLAGAELVSWMLPSVRLYRFGIRVLQQKRDLPLPQLRPGTQFDTKSGDFVLADTDTVLFRSRVRLFELRMYSPVPVKGTITWVDGAAIVEARLVVFPLLFFGLLGLVGATTIGAEVGRTYGLAGVALVGLWLLAMSAFLGLLARADFNTLMIALGEFADGAATGVDLTSASTSAPKVGIESSQDRRAG